MSPRTRPTKMASKRSSTHGSIMSEARRLPRTFQEPTRYSESYAHDLPHNALWTSIPSLEFPGSNDSQYDAMTLDSFPMEVDSYMMPMVSNMNDCYNTTGVYTSLSHGSMSQTLSGPYHDAMMGEEMLRTTSVGMEYQQYSHLPAANFRHGLPSPPAEVFGFQDQDLSMDTTCDLAFSTLPDSAVATNLPFDRLSSSSSPRQHQPRPIRSASERDNMHHSILAPQDSQYSRDERTDKVKARNDPRYEQGPDKNGYYHCPLLGDGSCSHKPTKQKCIYAKYLDSHLKPYLCKHGIDGECENLRFSSNACLFRHEREAHGMHNHGLNPYPCIFPGCERARKDNGFPRRWNQRDHMKRVHDWVDMDEADIEVQNYGRVIESTKRRKSSGSPNGVPMKRSTSSHSRAQVAAYTNGSRPAANVARYHIQADKQSQGCNTMRYTMPTGDVQFSPNPGYHQQTRTSSAYPGQPYMQLVC